MEELAQSINATSLCQLGGTAGNPVLSTIRYFRTNMSNISKKGDVLQATAKH